MKTVLRRLWFTDLLYVGRLENRMQDIIALGR